MTKTIIRVEGLSKLYHLGSRSTGYQTLRDSLAEAFRAPFKRHSNNDSNETIWALKNINFEVAPGEVIGICGSNGAGKSTLCRVLSRITDPTDGRVEMFGRVASLLEVGTGFHPELSGRENIYLNGALLGMKRTEINHKFDQIVDFAEVEKFLETPVKRYSSGMYTRLAFAVASHLEPEILVVDEVLAVGDAQFQKKCLRKMRNVATEGRTVLFVSHNMVAVQSLCHRCLWLDHGEVLKDGPAVSVISEYLMSRTNKQSEEFWMDIKSAIGNDIVRLRRVRTRLPEELSANVLTNKTPFMIEIEYWNLVPGARLHLALHLYTEQDIIAFSTGNGLQVATNEAYSDAGLFRAVCCIPADLLNSGHHRLVILVVKDGNTVVYRHESAVSFEVLDLQTREVGFYGREPGVVRPTLKWTTDRIEA